MINSGRSVSQNDSATSLPQRWKRGRQRAALSCLVLVVLFSGALRWQGGADALDALWLRARFSLREKFLGPQRDARIVLLEIDDKCLDRWVDKESGAPEPSLTWGGHIAGAIEQLNRSGARLIALDWTQTIESDLWLKRGDDERLGRALAQAQNVVFVTLVRPSGEYVRPAASLLYALPGAYKDQGDSYLGFAELITQDSVQTSLYPQIPMKNGRAVSFSQRIAEKSGLAPKEIPSLRDNGTVLINFANFTGSRGNDSPFERVSLSDVERQKTPDARWKDKIVLVGVTYTGNNDGHFVPFLNGLTGARLVDGVEVQANAVKTLLEGNAIVEPGKNSVWLLAALLGAMGVLAFALWSWGRAAFIIVGAALVWTTASFLLFCTHHLHLPLAVPLAALAFGAALMGGYRALSEERERAEVMKVWGRHQDPRLIQVLLDHPEWRGGEGREMNVTVLFADLKNFTKTVESLSPSEALKALNRYLSLLSATILEHGGVVDKYLGDGLMAQWGSPAPTPNHAVTAVRACQEIEKRLQILAAKLRAEGEVTFGVRLTLHSGPVVAGPLGSDERLEYTIIGDTVNVTSRLQETAKALECNFLVSQTTRDALSADASAPDVQFGRETEVEIRGRQQMLRVFEVINDESSH